MAKYKIGDAVWWASYKSIEKQVVCPDCFGKKYLTVILGDESKVTVECTGCQIAYNLPSGHVKTYGYAAKVTQCKIEGVEEGMSHRREVKYSVLGGYIVEDDCLADTKEQADYLSAMQIIEADKKEQERLASKEKPTRSWAWNATYHRGCVRRAEADLVYHKAKLVVALSHKKEC